MSKRLSVSLLDELMSELAALAAERGTTAGALAREALGVHLWELRFRESQAYGIARAEDRGIAPADLESLIDEGRTSRGQP